MRNTLLIVLLSSLCATASAQAPAPVSTPAPAVTKPAAETPAPAVAKPAAAAPATQPVAAPGAAIPADPGSAIDAGKSLWDAIKAHRWWFAVALGIYIVLFLLKIFGLFTLISTTWGWIIVAVLSLAAGAFAAFDKTGFNWATFLGYASAGPTIAYVRDFGKDVLLAWWRNRKGFQND